LKYIVQVELQPRDGEAVEANPAAIQELLGKWDALKPIGFYFALTRRAVTVIVDAPNEDAIFEALHATWVTTHSYPNVWPVVASDEFPAIMQRLGMAP
jgi:hypothetical protein